MLVGPVGVPVGPAFVVSADPLVRSSKAWGGYLEQLFVVLSASTASHSLFGDKVVNVFHDAGKKGGALAGSPDVLPAIKAKFR